jgi:hypothetical protein
MEFSKGETVEWIIEDKALLALRRLEAPAPVLKKTPPASSLSSSSSGTNASAPSTSNASPIARKTLAWSSLLCLARHTVTGLLTTSGSQFQDWSATCRLFSQDRVPAPEIFSVLRRSIADQLPADAPFRAVVDDSLLPRSGLHTRGVGWRRDPLGPRFQTKLCARPRFLQISAAMPGTQTALRLPPIAFLHTPTPQKPDRKATPEQAAQYRLDASSSRRSLRAAQQMIQLRRPLDQDPGGPGAHLDTRL